jgi:hypothetical protein
LNEFTNFDEGFGGMGTLLRVDPPGGCFASPTGATVAGGVLRTGSYTSLMASDNTYLQVNPKTTTRPTATTAGATSITVASAAGFPTAATVANPYYVRIDNEVLAVTGGAGTTTWTVQRGQLGTVASTHPVSAVVTALTTSWYAAFSGLPAGAGSLKVTYEGESCAVTTGTTCTAPSGATPLQTIQICKWSVAGSAGCAAPGGAGWVTLNSQPVGASDVTATLSPPGAADQYVGTGSVKGQLRVLVTLTHYTAPSPTPVAGWGDLMKIVYDAP